MTASQQSSSAETAARIGRETVSVEPLLHTYTAVNEDLASLQCSHASQIARYATSSVLPLSNTLPLTSGDITDIRNAIKLSAKFFQEIQRKWGPQETLPLHLHASEVATLLLMSGASRELVIAGFLHDVCEGYIKSDLQKLTTIIQRKFGDEVLNLVLSVTEPPKSGETGNWLERKICGLEKVRNGSVNEATLSCAAKISTIAAGNKFLYSGAPIEAWSAGSHEQNVIMFTLLREEYVKKGVPEFLLTQFDNELCRFAGWGDSDIAVNLVSDLKAGLESRISSGERRENSQAIRVRNALKLAVKFLRNETRQWGPDETLPLHTHSVEVTAMLLASGARHELVLAGCLHDVLELQTHPNIDKLKSVIERKFGKEVLNLVFSLTEPVQAHSPDTWQHRKDAILSQLREKSPDEAMLSCATKIAMIAEGNKFLYEEGTIEGWSNGSLEQNLQFFRSLRDIYVSKNVPVQILDQFDLELGRFASWAHPGTEGLKIADGTQQVA